jgi:hypothetical protein
MCPAPESSFPGARASLPAPGGKGFNPDRVLTNGSLYKSTNNRDKADSSTLPSVSTEPGRHDLFSRE